MLIDRVKECRIPKIGQPFQYLVFYSFLQTTIFTTGKEIKNIRYQMSRMYARVLKKIPAIFLSLVLPKKIAGSWVFVKASKSVGNFLICFRFKVKKHLSFYPVFVLCNLLFTFL